MLKLEPELEPYRAALEGSVRRIVTLAPVPRPPGAADRADALRSKFGGAIFWPAGVPYPANAGGRLFALAQLNLAELPPLPELPAAGLLQAFVDDDGDARVVYHGPETLGLPRADPAAIRSDYEFFAHELWLAGAAADTAVPPGSYDWELLLGEPADDWFARFGAAAGRVRAAYERDCTVAARHHLGGYARVQRADHDCRRSEPGAPGRRLLLAVHDDDAAFGALFGAHALYVEAADLARRDFSGIWLTFESWH